MTERSILKNVSPVIGTDDREACSKFWVALYTRPRSEKKASSELNRLGIETYLPIQKQLKLWSDRKKYINVTVIPMIIFAHINDNELLTIKQHSLIINILTFPGSKQPAHIPDKQIDNLKFMLGQSNVPVDFLQGSFFTDEKVIVVRGGLKGLVGTVTDVLDDMTTVWVAIDLLGGVIIKLKSTEVEHYM